MAIPGHIPLNIDGQRIDIVMFSPTTSQWNQWKQHDANAQKHQSSRIYYNFHLRSSCKDATCGFDHSYISPGVHYCLRYLVKVLPCKQHGGCRRLGCLKGHICQKKACIAGEARTCKFDDDRHNMDLRVAKWVKPGSDEGPRKDVITTPQVSEETSGGSVESWGTSFINLIDL